ncbi:MULTISPECIES: spike base protein, RCAP_Rcc01079 family [Sphingomonas]|uniref:Uncharacterized protein n=1 Tax=Edaphosphingomonas fennica TaxID=114404 RepID=A0A2T4HMF0_9SPHN|nr:MULTISPECIES: hypothetical protein [Sphingomonas]AGH51131.1 hypothetical protein G432_17065 [Sphingomonas sp. MM-1]MDX3885809.1 hypothetical protein [Sphingomonas sp.]PTD16965.1 hypothetical protein CV103_18175 [Sphingomonas fennica]
MADAFAASADAAYAPAMRAAAIVPHDSNPLNDITKAIYVGAGGDVAVRAARDGADHVWKAVPAGSILPIRASHVRATGTTAGDLLGLY